MNRMEKLRNAVPGIAAQRVGKKTWTLAPLMAALLGAGTAQAQQTASPTPQFDSIGFIQAATLDTGTLCPTANALLRGGTVTVNGIKMIVPCNTILQMPANTVSWAQLFDATVRAPIPAGALGLNGSATIPAGQSGLALADTAPNFTTPGAGGILLPTPFPSFEVHVVGNILKDATGNDQYIVGLIVPISQQGLNAGAGKITCIDYTAGALYVGGTNLAAGTTACAAANGTRVIINDPIGRYGKAHSPDPRFSADTNNTTIHAGSGYPMCIPRSAPPAVDPLCPVANRPLNGDGRFFIDRFLANGQPLKIFQMTPPAGQPFADPTGFPDPRQQAPFMVGDFVNWAGTLAKDATGQYISAHTLVANVGIFTWPATQPSYVTVDSLLLGTAGTPVQGIIQENTTRIFVTGFTTDPTQLVDLNAIDVNPCTGVEALRLLGTLDPATQPVLGRWRFHVLGGLFMPPTREMMAVSHDGTTASSLPGGAGFANGLGSGQYRVPNFTFIFPENVRLGEPVLPNNFQDFPFLTYGSGPLNGTGPVVGQLIPWPGVPVPAKASCSPAGTAPIVNAGLDFAVGPGRLEALAGTLTQDPNAAAPTISFTQTAGPAVVLTNANTLSPTFVTPAVAAAASVILTFKLTVTDTFGTTSATVNVTVLGTTDVLTGVTALWRAPTTPGQGVIVGVHKVGDKGGLLKVAAISSVSSNKLSLQTHALDLVGGLVPNTTGFMEIDPILGLPSYTFDASGTNAPATVIVRSSLGGEATVTVTLK
jgi:hypothetical protein